MEADVLIIGCGPSGIQAAIHSSRSKASTIIIGRPESSAAHGIRLENYFGFNGEVDGTALIEDGIRQAESFGARVVRSNILSAAVDCGLFKVSVESGEEYVSRSIILATGVSRTKLGVKGEKEFYGKGVSYCAVCDCNFYRGRTVVVVGSQSEAAVSADLMTRYASKTYWVLSDADVDDSLVKAAADAGAVILDSPVAEIRGVDKVTSIILEDGREVSTDGVFIELGGKSSADIAMDLGLMPEMDDSLKVGRDCSTSVPGVFACGDVTGRPWQVAKAVGEGAVAGLSAAAYARKLVG